MSDLVIQSVDATNQSEAKEMILQGLKKHFGFLDRTLNPDLDDIVHAYLEKGQTFLVGLLAGEVVCSGALIQVDAQLGRIVRMSVKQEHRRKGYASRMIEALEAVARDRGFGTITLKTLHHWEDAVGFYTARGYRSSGLAGESVTMVKVFGENPYARD
ncbi:GNAT family N-acetyltransferase [Paenibacillus koleovorans]|uniref:GNAT family N-acetyltransferase n=1 Tax=Paenibacillus koleovorans TaxID=121608 RepID=UPI000FDC451D|nr:GNAT family N-acetyltransferase [Paenibacillus koleovorans]